MAAICVVALCVCPAVSAQERAVRNVLTIHSGDEFFPSNPILDEAIRESLRSVREVPVDYYTEYLEGTRFGAAEASAALAEYIRVKYSKRQIDLVIASTNAPLQFVMNYRDELFPDAPIVFAGLTVPDQSIRLAGHGLAAVKIGSAYDETLKLALALHPSTERVFVVARSPNTNTVESVRAELREFSERMQVTYLNLETLVQLRNAVKAVPAGSLILYIWHIEDDGLARDPRDVARLVSEAATVPVYGAIDLNVGTGIVGGVVRGTRETGTRMGQMAVQILEGARPRDIPVEDAPLVPMFDGRQLRRWSIDRSRLPPGSIVQFSTPTIWEAYRAYIIGTLIVVAAQLLAIAGLLVQRNRRRRAEETVVLREATIRASYQRIRQLAGRLINAQESVRAGIARDLHDGVCQELSGVSIAVGSLKSSAGSLQDARTQQVLSKIYDEMLGMFEGVRRLTHDLHPATLRLLGLPAAVQAHCAEVERRHAVQVQCRVEGDFDDIHSDVGVCFFRIVQESLRNGVVHGEARRLSVSLSRSDNRVDLAVTDEGRGFDLEAVRRIGGGLGLVSIEERAHVIGGDVQIVTGLGQGTTIHVRAPARGGVSVQ